MADALPGENVVNLLAIVGPGSLVHLVVLDYHPGIQEGVMSNEDQAGAERGLVQQEVVVGVENKSGKESGLVDTQQ